MNGIRKAPSSVAEFIGRFWPTSKDEEDLLEELGAVGDGATDGSAIGDEL